MADPTGDDPLGRARRGLRAQRSTSVITTASTGVVLVDSASRLGSAAAVAIVVAAASALALRHAIAVDRRWRAARRTSAPAGVGDDER